jgi:hypothetical protein
MTSLVPPNGPLSFPTPATRAAVEDHIATTWATIEPLKALGLGWQSSGRDRAVGSDAWRVGFLGGDRCPGLEKWVSSQPAGATADAARISLGEVQLDHDPAMAMQTVQAHLGRCAARFRETVRFYRYWRKRDAAAAQAWLQSSGTPEIRQRVARR